MDCCTQELN